MFLLRVVVEYTAAQDALSSHELTTFAFLEANDKAEADALANKYEQYLSHSQGGDLVDANVAVVGEIEVPEGMYLSTVLDAAEIGSLIVDVNAYDAYDHHRRTGEPLAREEVADIVAAGLAKDEDFGCVGGDLYRLNSLSEEM